MKINAFISHILVSFMILVSMHLQAQDVDAVKKQIGEIAMKSSKQMVMGDFSTEYYASDAISLPNNGPMLEGIEALKANAEQMKQMGMKFDSFELTPKKVTLNGKMVTEIGLYSMSMTPPGAPAPITDKGKYLNIWEIQDDGSLKLKVETWNTDMPPAGM